MTKAAGPIITLEDASFRFGDDVVFPHANWVWRRGEQWAILGPNGSGKTLFAAAIRGLLPIVAGDLRYHFRGSVALGPEEAISEVCFSDRKLNLAGAVAQSRWFSLEEEASMQVADLLSYQRVMQINPYEVTDRHARARPAFEQRKRRAIELLRLAPLLPQSVLSLSNGESQRVHLARALCRPLRMLILDDPWLGLDTEMRELFRQVLKHLMRNVPVLFLASTEEHLPEGITNILRLEACTVASQEIRRTKRIPQLSAHRAKPQTPTRVEVSNSQRTSSRVLLEMRNVTVRYGERVVLNRVNWKVRRGESWAVLGANGCGKSTLLSLILGDHPQAHSNDIVLFGKRLGADESIWERKRKLGWVAPELQLHFMETVTCFETVASGYHDTIGVFSELRPEQISQVRHWLKRFRLEQYADTPFAALSAGAQRAALLGRALVKKPLLLLLDEPCQGLDPEHRAIFLRTLARLAASPGTSVIYVTHRPEEIPPTIKNQLRLCRP